MQTAPETGPQGPIVTLRIVGAIFIGLGLLAIALPASATIAVEQLVAAILLVWGAAGLGFGLSLRPNPEWRMTAALFAMILALGAIFLAFPKDGIATMTMLLVAVYLIQGAASVSIGIGLRSQMRNWAFLVLSGVTSLILGVLILSGWPGTAIWILGLLTGFNFVTTGIALILLGHGSDGATPV